MDCSRYRVTNYLTDGKTHSAKDSKRFRRLNQKTDQLYEGELVRSKNEQRKPIIAGFIILQNTKLRMLELFYIFFKTFRDTDKYEELEMDADSL